MSQSYFEVKNRFSPEFFAANIHDPYFHAIVLSLTRGGDPYRLLEMVLDNRTQIIKVVEKHIANEKNSGE